MGGPQKVAQLGQEGGDAHEGGHVVVADDVGTQLDFDTLVEHRTDVLPLAGLAGRGREGNREEQVVGDSVEPLDLAGDAVAEQAELEGDVETHVLLPLEFLVTGGRALEEAWRVGVTVDAVE